MNCRSLFLFSALVLGMFYQSCAAFKPSAQNNAPIDTPHIETTTTKAYILTLVLEATKTQNDSVVFSTYNVFKNEGYLKKEAKQNSEDAWVVYFEDNKGTILDSTYFIHPLEELIEVDNGNKTLKKQIHYKNNAFFDFRINYQPAMQQMRFVQLKNKHTQIIPLKNI